MTLINNIFLENTFVINIQENETYKNTCKVLDRFGFKYERFPAYIHKKYGITKSNLEIIKHGKKKNLDYVIICEDDLNSDVYDEKEIFNFQQKIKKYFDYEWDMMILESKIEKYEKIDDDALYVKGGLGFGLYIVKKKSYDKMITILNNIIYNIKKKDNIIYDRLDAIDSRYRYFMYNNILKAISIVPRIFYQDRIEFFSRKNEEDDNSIIFYEKLLHVDKENGVLDDMENLKKWKSFISLSKK